MSFWMLVQIFVNLVLLAGFGFVWFRLNRPAKDDPRLSRGLQLLQSKIAVLEDLSDRTETQFHQITNLMEQKIRDVQGYIVQAEKQVQKIESSMGKSLEVAKIFQDKIPHQEIIERQNTVKYVKAARLAHQGLSVEEISQQVDLSRGEIEFIAKVNRDQLQFSEADLPAWAQEDAEGAEEMQERPLIEEPATRQALRQQEENKQVQRLHQAVNDEQTSMLQSTIASQSAVQQTLSQLGDQFRKATTFVEPEEEASPVVQVPVQAHVAPAIQKPIQQPIKNSINQVRDSSAGVVKKVVFPRIDDPFMG